MKKKKIYFSDNKKTGRYLNEKLQQLLDTYTRIKLRIDSEIQVNYYRHGRKCKKNIILSNLCGFLYLNGTSVKSGEMVQIEFFGKDTMIESIMVEGSNIPVYYNSFSDKNYITNRKLLFEMNKIMFDLEYDDIDFYKTYYDREQLIKKYLSKNCNFKYEDLFFSDKQKEEFEAFFKIIVDELSSYARKKELDDEIKFISYGKTSLIYEIGDKIIKVGKPRRCNYIPYCEYLLQPIINRNFSFDGYPIHIEITQKVKVLKNVKNTAYSKNKLYTEIVNQLERNLLSIGLCCKDLHPGNVGILIKDNKINYDEIGFDVVDDRVSSIESNNNSRILDKGNFVIIDLDSIYIQDIIRYSEYLKSIGYDEDKALNVVYNTKCKILNYWN